LMEQERPPKIAVIQKHDVLRDVVPLFANFVSFDTFNDEGDKVGIIHGQAALNSCYSLCTNPTNRAKVTVDHMEILELYGFCLTPAERLAAQRLAEDLETRSLVEPGDALVAQARTPSSAASSSRRASSSSPRADRAEQAKADKEAVVDKSFKKLKASIFNGTISKEPPTGARI
jgi:hypothetical protein